MIYTNYPRKNLSCNAEVVFSLFVWILWIYWVWIRIRSAWLRVTILRDVVNADLVDVVTDYSELHLAHILVLAVVIVTVPIIVVCIILVDVVDFFC